MQDFLTHLLFQRLEYRRETHPYALAPFSLAMTLCIEKDPDSKYILDEHISTLIEDCLTTDINRIKDTVSELSNYATIYSVNPDCSIYKRICGTIKTICERYPSLIP